MFTTGQRSVQKVITGKLYDSEGRKVENIDVDDPINWDEEMENASKISQEEVI